QGAAQLLVVLECGPAWARPLDWLGLGHARGVDREKALGRRAQNRDIAELEQRAVRDRADPPEPAVRLQRLDRGADAPCVREADLVRLAVANLPPALVDSLEVRVAVVP